MSRSKQSPGESVVRRAARHRQLQNALVALDAVAGVDTICDGARTADAEPSFRTEVVLAPAFDTVPPTVLEAVAAADLGIAAADPQGDQLVAVVEQ